MPEKWQKWYPHHIDAWLASDRVRDMSDAAYRAYHTLLMRQFQQPDGMLPADEAELAKLCRKGSRWNEIREQVMEHFEKGAEGRVYDPRLYHEWEKASKIHIAKSNGAKEMWKPKDTLRTPDGYLKDSITHIHKQKQQQEQKTKDKLQQPKTLARFTSSDIEQIYQAYPRKVGKGAALKAIRKALERIDSETPAADLLAIVREYAESPAGNNGEFTPHPATFFNQSRYLDNREEWKKVR